MKTKRTMIDKDEALQIVKAILSNTLSPERISIGDAKTYYPVMVDGNRWKTICRFYLQETKFIGIISERRVETRARIFRPEDILKFAVDMQVIAKKYS